MTQHLHTPSPISSTSTSLSNGATNGATNEVLQTQGVTRQPSFAKRLVRSVSSSGREKIQSFKARRHRSSAASTTATLASTSTSTSTRSTRTSAPTSTPSASKSTLTSAPQSASTEKEVQQMDPATSLPSKEEAKAQAIQQMERERASTLIASPAPIEALLTPLPPSPSPSPAPNQTQLVPSTSTSPTASGSQAGTGTGTGSATGTTDGDSHLFPVPPQARQGIKLLKVTSKKSSPKWFYILPESGQVVWNSSSSAKMKKGVELSGFAIESIREIRTGSAARPPFRIALNAKQEKMCLAVIYTVKGEGLKTLYTVGLEGGTWEVWRDTLGRLWNQRKAWRGLEGEEKAEEKEGAWEKLVWSVADEPAAPVPGLVNPNPGAVPPGGSAAGNGSRVGIGVGPDGLLSNQGDGKLTMGEIVRMCKKLGICVSEEAILGNFKKVDTTSRGYLDFPQFRTFVKFLKRRSEIESLFQTFRTPSSRGLTSTEFLKFMQEEQKSSLSVQQIYDLFSRFSKPETEAKKEQEPAPAQKAEEEKEEEKRLPLLERLGDAMDQLEEEVREKVGRPDEELGRVVDIPTLEKEEQEQEQMEKKEEEKERKEEEEWEKVEEEGEQKAQELSEGAGEAKDVILELKDQGKEKIIIPDPSSIAPPAEAPTPTAPAASSTTNELPAESAASTDPPTPPTQVSATTQAATSPFPSIAPANGSPVARHATLAHLLPHHLRNKSASTRPSTPPAPTLPPPPPPPGVMTLGCFTSFLVSNFNTPFEEDHRKVCMDMSRPLWDYFMCSSHNTYLVGNQLQGDSTVEGYVRALQQGCRTVELDCWDGPDEPVVYHGRTMTSKILARDAFTAIDKYAFVASPYPVILSIEVHCNMAQQDKLADIMKECFGEKLVHRSIDEREQDIQVLPSPEELKYRILVKAKNKFISPPKAEEPEQEEVMSDPSSLTSDSSSDSDFKRVVSGFYRRVRKGRSPSETGKPERPHSPPSQLSIADAANAKLEEKGRRPSVPTSPTSPSAFVAPPISPTNTSKEKGSKPVMSFALAALIVYTVGVKGRGFNKKEYYAPTHVISIGERKLLKIVKETKMDLISHTRNHVVRAYPAGRRFTSSNYVPVNFWSAGMQMVALNWQTFDLGMEINTALFARNGKCGYVLKPEILRVKGKDKAALTTNFKYELDLTLLSAQQLPRITKEKKDDDGPTVSPYVEITVYAPGMTSVPSRKTRVIRGNGFNPCWNENFKIRFEVQAGMLDLTFIRFEVFEAETAASDKTLGRYCICAQSLLPGYRHLPLYDQFGDEYLFSSLFIKSQIKSLSSKVE